MNEENRIGKFGGELPYSERYVPSTRWEPEDWDVATTDYECEYFKVGGKFAVKCEFQEPHPKLDRYYGLELKRLKILNVEKANPEESIDLYGEPFQLLKSVTFFSKQRPYLGLSMEFVQRNIEEETYDLLEKITDVM